MAQHAAFADIEADLCRYLAGWLAEAGAGQPWSDVTVSNANIDFETRAPWSVLVRDDGGRTTSAVTRSHAIGTTIIGPDDGSDPEGLHTRDLAEQVMLAIAHAPFDPTTAVAAVDSQLGPYRIVHGNGVRPARYATHEVVAAGFESGI